VTLTEKILIVALGLSAVAIIVKSGALHRDD
jgi:hypothetical protein